MLDIADSIESTDEKKDSILLEIKFLLCKSLELAVYMRLTISDNYFLYSSSTIVFILSSLPIAGYLSSVSTKNCIVNTAQRFHINNFSVHEVLLVCKSNVDIALIQITLLV